MTQFQKLIKGFAIAVAVLIAITIIGAIVTAIFAISSVVCDEDEMNPTEEVYEINIDDEYESSAEDGHDHEYVPNQTAVYNIEETYRINEVDSLEIENSVGNLTVEAADVDEIQVIGVNLSEASRVELSGDTLHIENTSVKVVLFGINMGEKVTHANPGITVRVPRGFVFDEIEIESGVGTVTMDGITADEMYLVSGTGTIDATDITCGDVDIDAGVGEVNIYLNAEMTDYDMDLTPGIGAIYVDGIQQSEINHTNKDADYSLNVDSGIGEVNIHFNK